MYLLKKMSLSVYTNKLIYVKVTFLNPTVWPVDHKILIWIDVLQLWTTEHTAPTESEMWMCFSPVNLLKYGQSTEIEVHSSYSVKIIYYLMMLVNEFVV
jgi:hypothetical protein